MRFRDRKLQSSFLTRSDRSRLVRLGIALILLVMAIKVAADPATWVWMFPKSPAGGNATPTLAGVSYDVALDGDGELRPDEFRAEPIRPIQANDSDLVDEASREAQALAAVEDDTLSLRQAEHKAYDALLSRLREQDEAQLEGSVEAGASYPAVMMEPSHYRGRTVELEGTARRILELPAGANPHVFKRLYELWVFTPDSGDNPWRVVAIDIPDSLPRGVLDKGVAVKIAGVFFKRQGYETQAHALHVAPLVLAKTVRPIHPASKAITEFDPTPWLIGTAILVALCFTFLFYRFRREDLAFERTTLDRLTRAEPGELDSIADGETHDPESFFQRLAITETTDDPDRDAERL